MRPRGLFLATGLAVFVGLAIGLPTANNVVPEDAAFPPAVQELQSDGGEFIYVLFWGLLKHLSGPSSPRLARGVSPGSHNKQDPAAFVARRVAAVTALAQNVQACHLAGRAVYHAA